MLRGIDSNGSPFIAWEQPRGGFKRAWVQHRDGETDWAQTGRYVMVARTETLEGGPKGMSADFPVYFKEEQAPDRQVLEAFVLSICLITGCAVLDSWL